MSTKETITIISLLFVVAATVVYEDFSKPRVVRYDCSISEISPDYPIEVKEQCRKLRATNYNKT